MTYWDCNFLGGFSLSGGRWRGGRQQPQEGLNHPGQGSQRKEEAAWPRPSKPLTTICPLPLLKGLPTQVLGGHLIHTRFEAMPELESILLSLSLFLYQMGLTQTFGEEVAQGGRHRTGEGEGHGHCKDRRKWIGGKGQVGAHGTFWERPGHSEGFTPSYGC